MGPVSPRLLQARQLRRHGAHLTRDLSKDELRAYRAAKSRRARTHFDLSLAEFRLMVAAANGRCEMTNITFSDDVASGLRIRPFRMSVDRIDSALGYTLENCQLVCSIFNVAKNAASEQLVHTVMLEYARANGVTPPDSLVLKKGTDRWEY